MRVDWVPLTRVDEYGYFGGRRSSGGAKARLPTLRSFRRTTWSLTNGINRVMKSVIIKIVARNVREECGLQIGARMEKDANNYWQTWRE